MANTFLDKRVVKGGPNGFVGQKNPFDLTAFVANYVTGATIAPVGPLLVFKNGLNLIGTTVRYGGLLTDTTTITEDNYGHKHTRTEDPAGNGDVTTTYTSVEEDALGAGSNQLVRKLFSNDAVTGSTAQVGVAGDADVNNSVFISTAVSTVSSLTQFNDNSITIIQKDGVTTDGIIQFTGGQLSINSEDNSSWQVQGTRLDSYVDKTEAIGASFGVKRETIEIDSTINSTSPVTLTTLTSASQSQVTISGTLNYRKSGVTGMGSIHFTSTFYNQGGYVIPTAAPVVISQDDDIADGVTVDFAHSVSGSGWAFTCDANQAVNTRIQGTLTVTTTSIAETF